MSNPAAYKRLAMLEKAKRYGATGPQLSAINRAYARQLQSQQRNYHKWSTSYAKALRESQRGYPELLADFLADKLTVDEFEDGVAKLLTDGKLPATFKPPKATVPEGLWAGVVVGILCLAGAECIAYGVLQLL